MKETLLTLLDYEQWANRQLIESLLQVSRPPERSIQVMGHILSVQQVWFDRIQGRNESIAIWQSIPVDAMLPMAVEHNGMIRDYLTKTDESALNQAVAYHNSKGEAFTNTPQDILLHLSHHAAYHRGQVVQLIRPQLKQAPLIDYILWRRAM